MSIRTVVQCHGHTASGARCKKRTAKSPLCWIHLEKEDHVRIKESTIPHAGLGLFTTIARRPHQKVTLYAKGSYVDHTPGHGGEYVLQVKNNPPTFVDGAETTSGAGRYANNPRRGMRGVPQGSTNAGLGFSTRTDTAFVKTLNRGVPAGRELKASYGHNAGQEYWDRNRQ